MTDLDMVYTLMLLLIAAGLTIGIVSAAERYLLWRRRRAIDRIAREAEREQLAWRSTWGGDY